MKFTVWKTSDDDYISEVEINSIEQLIEFAEERTDYNRLVLLRDYTKAKTNEWVLEIYNTYRE